MSRDTPHIVQDDVRGKRGRLVSADPLPVKWPMLLMVLCLLAACSSVDRLAMTEFRPIGDSAFEYKAKADAMYPDDTVSAEATRLKWLKQYLEDNGYCPTGYEITERLVVTRFQGLLGNLVDIFYTGRCI